MPLKRIAKKLVQIWELVWSGNISIAIETISEWIWSDTYAIGLKRDLSITFVPDATVLGLRVREMQKKDFEAVFGAYNAVGEDARTLLSFESFFRQGIGSRYVATNRDGNPSYIAALITSKDNLAQKKHFRGYLPELKAGEALIENLYTVIEFRRQGIHSYATHLICQEAKKMGLQSVFIYIGCGNTGSLKGASNAGFKAHSMRVDSWRFFRRSIKFMLIDERSDPTGICKEALSYLLNTSPAH